METEGRDRAVRKRDSMVVVGGGRQERGERVVRVLMPREPPRPTAAWPAMTDKRREANSGFWI